MDLFIPDVQLTTGGRREGGGDGEAQQEASMLGLDEAHKLPLMDVPILEVGVHRDQTRPHITPRRRAPRPPLPPRVWTNKGRESEMKAGEDRETKGERKGPARR